MNIYVSNPGATSECLVVPEKFKLVNRWGLDVSDSFTFTSQTKTIVPGAAIRVLNDNDRCVFGGIILDYNGDYNSECWQWTCMHRVGIAKRRYMHPITYSSALTLSEVLSSNPPSQSAGDDQYIPGIIWSLNSELPYGTGDAGSDGIITISGFGSANTGSVNVYYDGHLCAQASSLGDIDSSSYRYYQDTTTLYVYGTGSGDVYGQIGLSNLFDSGLRLGTIDNDDNLMAALKIKNNNIVWKIISELVEDHSQYLSLRDQTHLDITTTKQGRGTFDDPIHELLEENIITYNRIRDPYPPSNALVGIGAKDNVIYGERYARATIRSGRAWIEELLTIEGGYNSPSGILDEKIDYVFDNESESTQSIKLSTKLDFIFPGDIIKINMGSTSHTLRVQTIGVTEQLEYEIQLGSKNLEIEKTFSATERTLEDYQISTRVGDDWMYGELGIVSGSPIDLEANFTTADFTGQEDKALILLSLEATDTTEFEDTERSVTFVVEVNGSEVARIRSVPWIPNPITDLNITSGSYIDGTENEITISVEDPLGTLDESHWYTIHVRGTYLNDEPGAYQAYPSADAYNDGLGYYGESTYSECLNASTGSWVYTEDDNYLYCEIENGPLPSLHPTVQIKAYCDSDTWPFYGIHGQARTVLRTHGVIYNSDWYDLDEDNVWISSQIYTTNPYTTQNWTKSELDALQAGIEMRITPWEGQGWGYYAHCYSLYVEVDTGN